MPVFGIFMIASGICAICFAVQYIDTKKLKTLVDEMTKSGYVMRIRSFVAV